MKVLIVEDTVIKFIDIKRALTEICRDIEIVHVRSLNSAKNILDEAGEEEYQLIVTDMRYPEENYRQELLDAGFQLIEYVNEKRLGIPMIICSTSRFLDRDEGVIGTVQYNDQVDLRMEFKRIFDTKLSV